MKTITVISDTHGNRADVRKLDGVFAESNYIIHLGDVSGDGAAIYSAYPEKTVVINGNCDPAKFGEDEVVLEIEGIKIFATHGHLYSVKSGRARLAQRANELGCRIALYGHTHRADESELEGVTLINPGAMSRYFNKSYSYVVINGGKFTHKNVILY